MKTASQNYSHRVELIFFDAGGGHRAAASALKGVIEQQRRPWRVRMVNLRDVLGPIDFVRNLTGVRFEDFYNGLLKHGLTRGSEPMLRLSQMLIRLRHAKEVEWLSRYWHAWRPDMVISLIPNFNRAIFDGLRAADAMLGRRPAPMVTILTDLADCPPHFWMEQQEQYFICGTARAVEQALAMGHRRQRVFRTSGMIVRSEFYRPLEIRREDERRRFGLDPHRPTGLVMFGGYGSRQMLTVAKRIARARLNTQLIFLCGHNDRLKERLAAMNLPYPHHIEGFTREVPYFMQLADFFVGKPGPGSISEALLMELPVVVERNANTMVQERFNADWIQQQGFGVVLGSLREIARGVAPMLDANQLANFRTRITASKNRALFEIPDILETLIAPAADKSAREPLRMNSREAQAARVSLNLITQPLSRVWRTITEGNPMRYSRHP